MAVQSKTPSKVPPLRAVREAQGLTLRETAERAGVDFSYLARIERGQAAGSITTLRKLAEALGMRDVAILFAKYDPEAK